MANQDFNYQYYVDTVKLVKQKEIPWHVFAKLMQELSYSDVNRLKYLNAILLTELTVSHSVMDRLKYLNVILMGKFKDCIQIDNDTNLEINHDLNDETLKESSSDREIQISVVIKIEKQENFDMPIHKFIDFNEIEDDAEICENEDAVDESNSTIVDYDFNEDTTEVSKNENLEGDHDLNIETITEISSCGQNEIQGKYFIQTEDDVELSENEDREVSLKSTNDHDRNDQTMIILIPQTLKTMHPLQAKLKGSKIWIPKSIRRENLSLLLLHLIMDIRITNVNLVPNYLLQYNI